MRDVPYFPCYASNLLANRNFKMMSLQERGLWASIYFECWPNGGVPEDPKKLSRYFGVDEMQIRECLTSEVLSFFQSKDGLLISPEIEDYRITVLKRRELQRLGGIEGARRGKGLRGKQSEPVGQPMGEPTGELEGSLNHIKLDQVNSNQLIDKRGMDDSNDAWVRDYDNAPTASSRDYIKASKGG